MVMGNSMNADIKGTQRGEFTGNMKTGMITGGENQVKLEAEIMGPGHSVPINITMKRKFSSKEL